MDKLRQAAQQALDYIRSTTDYKMGHPPACEAVLDLVDALAEQPAEQEPIAWGLPRSDGQIMDVITPDEHARCEGGYTVPMYAAPQPAKREPLTQQDALEVAAAIRALKEKT